MKIFTQITLMAMALLAVNAAPAPNAVESNTTDASAGFFLKNCVPGTEQIIPLGDGVMEYRCRNKFKKNGNRSATFGTNLYVQTKDGGFGVSLGGFGGSYQGTATGFQFAGYVDSWFNLAVTYPMKKSIAEVENLPRKCTSDGHFCFDIYEGVCLFGFDSQTKSRSCPLLKVIEFTTNM